MIGVYICCLRQSWWYASIIPAFRKLRQEDCGFIASLVYKARHYLKKNMFS